MRRRVSFLLAQPKRILLFTAIISWYGLLSSLKPFVKLDRLVSFTIPQQPRHQSLPLDDVLVMLRWLHIRRLERGDCLVQALVGYRFLSLSGEYPVMIVGVKPPDNAHAWLENNGQLMLEAAANIDGFVPILRLKDNCLESISK